MAAGSQRTISAIYRILSALLMHIMLYSLATLLDHNFLIAVESHFVIHAPSARPERLMQVSSNGCHDFARERPSRRRAKRSLQSQNQALAFTWALKDILRPAKGVGRKAVDAAERTNPL